MKALNSAGLKIVAENLESGSYIKPRNVQRSRSIWKKAVRSVGIGLTDT
jgi:hypothetical protein